jgi:hypothetical protein
MLKDRDATLEVYARDAPVRKGLAREHFALDVQK